LELEERMIDILDLIFLLGQALCLLALTAGAVLSFMAGPAA
jgi:hypothetical protein